MVGTGKKVEVERKKETEGKRKTGKGREGEEIVHGHGAGDTGVITRPRGRSGSSVCISPNSLCFASFPGLPSTTHIDHSFRNVAERGTTATSSTSITSSR